MDINTIAKEIASYLYEGICIIGILLAMPLILIEYIVLRVSEERELRALAADAGMTLDEYLDAEHRRVAEYLERNHGNV